MARATVKRWVQRERARGEPALAARKQGRPLHRGPSFGASSPPGAAVGGPARRPNRVVLPAALQSRTQPGRVLEPGHMIVIYLG